MLEELRYKIIQSTVSASSTDFQNQHCVLNSNMGNDKGQSVQPIYALIDDTQVKQRTSTL